MDVNISFHYHNSSENVSAIIFLLRRALWELFLTGKMFPEELICWWKCSLHVLNACQCCTFVSADVELGCYLLQYLDNSCQLEYVQNETLKDPRTPLLSAFKLKLAAPWSVHESQAMYWNHLLHWENNANQCSFRCKAVGWIGILCWDGRDSVGYVFLWFTIIPSLFCYICWTPTITPGSCTRQSLVTIYKQLRRSCGVKAAHLCM